MDTIPFFLVNRDLASLVLDHLDHKSIGSFRLVCRAANACATGAFLRTSSRARLSEYSLMCPSYYGGLQGDKGCSNCWSSVCRCNITVPVSVMKDKMANWKIVVVDSLDGFLELARILGNNNELVAPQVVTISLGSRFIIQYVRQFRDLSADDDIHNGSGAFRIIASRMNPRNLCLGWHNTDEFSFALEDYTSSWPLENVAYHAWLKGAPLIRNVPHQHVFCHRSMRRHWETVSLVTYPAQKVTGIQSITHRIRPNQIRFDCAGVRHWIPSDFSHVLDKDRPDREMLGPEGVRYIFPAFTSSFDCPFCGMEVI